MPGIFLTAWGFLKGVPWQVYVIAGLLLAVWLWGNHRYEQGEQSREPELQAAEARHALTRQSLTLLESRLAGMIDAGKVTRQNVEEAVSEAKERSDDLRSQADAVRAQTGSDCVTPDAVRNADL